MEKLKWTLQYIGITLKHKYYVFLAGLRTKAPVWRLVIHDWSKFTPSEAPHYGRQFFGTSDDPEGFKKAWHHHIRKNPHHWEHWTAEFHPSGELTPMPGWAVREMVADWMGASRAYDGRTPTSLATWPWFQANYAKVLSKLHPDSRSYLMQLVEEVFPSNRVTLELQ